jgi:hypothetical protein
VAPTQPSDVFSWVPLGNNEPSLHHKVSISESISITKRHENNERIAEFQRVQKKPVVLQGTAQKALACRQQPPNPTYQP